MSGGNWTKLVTVTTGQLITASERNNEFDNVIANANQDGVAGASEDLSHMQSQTDPNPGGSPSLALSGRGELTALRYIMALITGKTYWYTHPDISLASIAPTVWPLGMIGDYPSATPPNSSFKLCDGTAINRTTYAALFAITSTAFGVGDGSTTFNLPNYTDKMSIGAGNLYALAATGGAVTVNLAHTHTVSSHTHDLASHTHTMGNHTHSTPAHTHTLNSGTSVNATSPVVATSSIVIDTGGELMQAPGAAQNTTKPRALSTTTSGGSGTSGTPSTNTSDGPSSNTSGSAAPATDSQLSSSQSVLNPYLAMYKMIRVL